MSLCESFLNPHIMWRSPAQHITIWRSKSNKKNVTCTRKIVECRAANFRWTLHKKTNLKQSSKSVATKLDDFPYIFSRTNRYIDQIIIGFMCLPKHGSLYLTRGNLVSDLI